LIKAALRELAGSSVKEAGFEQMDEEEKKKWPRKYWWFRVEN
jgi:hypothetical protein